MKIVYIAHPISGDVLNNIIRIEAILHVLLTARNDYWPIAPYLHACKYLDDSNSRDRNRAFAVNKMFFDRGMFDELWVCGQLSGGVQQEIDWAKENNIPVIFKEF